MKIVDPNGVWLVSRAFFPLSDPETGTVFEPGVPTRVAFSDWAKHQGVIHEIPDPLTPAVEPVAEVTAPVEPVAEVPVEAPVPVEPEPVPEVLAPAPKAKK